MDFDSLSGVITLNSGDRIIPSKHFGLCPFHELTKEGFTTSQWSLSRGGMPVPDDVWALDIFQRDENSNVVSMLSQDRWMMPQIFTVIFDHFEGCGKNNLLMKIRNALELDR